MNLLSSCTGSVQCQSTTRLGPQFQHLLGYNSPHDQPLRNRRAEELRTSEDRPCVRFDNYTELETPWPRCRAQAKDIRRPSLKPRCL